MMLMSMAGGGRRARGGTRGARAARPSDLECRTVRAHEIDQRQRTLKRTRIKTLREHIPLVSRGLLIDEFVLPAPVHKDLMNNTDSDAFGPRQVP